MSTNEWLGMVAHAPHPSDRGSGTEAQASREESETLSPNNQIKTDWRHSSSHSDS
jgi:hypothetical protein